MMLYRIGPPIQEPHKLQRITVVFSCQKGVFMRDEDITPKMCLDLKDQCIKECRQENEEGVYRKFLEGHDRLRPFLVKM